MNQLTGDILFQMLDQTNVRIWHYDTARDMICYICSNGDIEEEIPFTVHMDMKHPDDRQQVYEDLERIQNGDILPTPIMIRYKDCSQPDGYHYTYNAIVPVWKDGGLQVYGSEQDITSMVRKQQLAEEQTQRIEALLKNSEMETWTIHRATNTVVINTKDGDTEEMTISSLNDKIIKSKSTGAVEALETMRRGEAKFLDFELAGYIKSNDEVSHLHCTAMPSKYDYNGNIIEYAGLSTDITDSVVDKEALTKAVTEAEEQSKQKSVFVARASHDLRNPLNVLLSLSDMMCEDISLEERRELSDMMKQSGEALHNLINDILDLTRIESGTLMFDKTTFEILPIIEGHINAFDIQSRQSHNIKLHTEIDKATVTTDKKRIGQIIDNYLSNAIKYSPVGSDIDVLVTNNEASGLRIAVTDHGCGISDTDKANVFGEFQRFNSEVTGTGLGLSICKRIASNLGGSVGFESQLGVGSTFWFELK